MKKIVLYVMLVLLAVCSFLIGYGLKKCNCEVDNTENNKEESVNEMYQNFSLKLVEYIQAEYKEEIDSNTLEEGTYTVTLGEFKEKGYDISMFKNKESGKQCNLEETYARLIVIGKTDEGTLDYTFNSYMNCEG